MGLVFILPHPNSNLIFVDFQEHFVDCWVSSNVHKSQFVKKVASFGLSKRLSLLYGKPKVKLDTMKSSLEVIKILKIQKRKMLIHLYPKMHLEN
jgi:hypothetical protein